MTVTPLKHDADSVLIQLGVALHNLKHVPFQEIIDTKLINEDNKEICGLEAFADIGKELAAIGLALLSYIEDNK